jgi:DNA-binding FadR family transcriptional regulator
VTHASIRLDDDQLERLADLIAERLRDAPPARGPLVDARELARLLGVSRSSVYEHARDLGASGVVSDSILPLQCGSSSRDWPMRQRIDRLSRGAASGGRLVSKLLDVILFLSPQPSGTATLACGGMQLAILRATSAGARPGRVRTG